MTDEYIKTNKQCKAHIGKRLYWDDVSARYIFLRSGIVEEVFGRHMNCGGNIYSIRDLKNLRNFENGGAWARNKEALK